MEQNIQSLIDLITANTNLLPEEKAMMISRLKEADKKNAVTELKPDHAEKVKRTTAILLEETTEELENKRKTIEALNKELEIESSLERVRAIAMSMMKPDDLMSICEIMFHELKKLGFADLRNAMINIHYDDKQYLLNYDYAEGTGRTETKFIYNSHPIVNNIVHHATQSSDGFTEMTYAGKALQELRDFRKQNGESDDERLNGIDTLYYYFYTIKTGAIGISNYSAVTSEQLNVLKRFRNVFDLAYKRYIDITNAEAQAREAQIQLALERVRAKMMAMQKSGELSEVVHIVFQQLKELHIVNENSRVQIGIINEQTGINEHWTTNIGGTFLDRTFRLPLKDYPYPNEQLFEKWRTTNKEARKNLVTVTEYKGQALKKAFDYLVNHSEFSDDDNLSELDIKLLNALYVYEAWFSDGNLVISVPDRLDQKSQDILRRFAAAFEQAYTRFLDLKNAETQAREAQIQLALERVRSRSLAMHSPNELVNVVAIVFEQLGVLGFNLDGSAIVINLFREGTKDITQWIVDADHHFPYSFHHPHFDNKILNDIQHAREKGLDYFSNVYSFDEKNKFWNYYFENTDFKRFPKKLQSEILSKESYAQSMALEKHTGILNPNINGKVLNNDQREILKRFTKVFEQAYVRFLDLQKAETQAREAQIQLALERVRARTMAMQKSDELAETASLLFRQVKALGIKTYASGFTIWENNDNDLVSWMCNADGSVNPPFKMPAGEIEWHKQQYKSWQNKEAYIIKDFTGKDMKEHYKYLRSFPLLDEAFRKSEAAGVSTPERQVHNAFNFSYGNLLFITYEPVPETYDIFQRFANTFDQTYTRFLDLQKAEAQAREAQIEAALERVRSRSMAMHRSDELKEVIRLVLEQFVLLNINAEHAGFYIDYKAHDDMHIWLADPNIEPFYAVIPYFDTPTWNSFLDAKANGRELHTDLLDFEEKNKFYQSLFKIFTIPEEAKAFYMQCKGLAVSTVLLDSVGLYIENFSAIPYTDEENKILMRFGKVFQQTYTRFLDLQKAESQAREAQIEAALEKVRSRTLAMQKSDELAETSAVLFQQLKNLGISPNRLYISIMKDDEGDTEFWITDEDGTKVSMAYEDNLNNNPSFKKMYEGWKAKSKSLVIDMQGEELQQYFQYLSSIHVPFKDGLAQKRRLQYIAFFSNGFIGMASPDEQPAETLQLLERFAYVFNLTFTRFNDLQVAEAHAAQAEQDLIEIKAARKKAEDALNELQATQKQLIQAEKMASLGELTAGIAHEIQNPLNFVNNFSEVSNELIDELLSEKSKDKSERDETLESELLNDIKQNLEKINHHGKRADAIVKGMLQHSRKSEGKKEPTDINALCDEYMRLSYHGLRAKDKTFNATFTTSLDPLVGKINIVPQEIGRVVLNLINNAFYAVNEKLKAETLHHSSSYKPIVSVATKKMNDKISIAVSDNGNGIPETLKEKIFQPFFTTKPTGSGTGLGLSLSYDIIKAHGGEIKVESKEGEGTEFIILLPALE